jgi:hypothetical protein
MMLVWGRRGEGAGTLGPDENDDGAMWHALFMYCYVVLFIVCCTRVLHECTTTTCNFLSFFSEA